MLSVPSLLNCHCADGLLTPEQIALSFCDESVNVSLYWLVLVMPKLNWFAWLFCPISRAGKIANWPPIEFVPFRAPSSELRYTNSVDVHCGLATLMLKSSK